MDFNSVLDRRFSVRDFKEDCPTDDVIDKLLSVINKAPSAKNIQPYHVRVLKSKESLDKIRGITKSAYNAPIVLMLTAVTNDTWKNPYSGYDTGAIDCAILATYLMLEATNLGLDSVFVCWFNEEKIKEEFSIEGEQVVCLLPIGYRQDDVVPSESHFKKKDLNEIVIKC